jgi:hypothetical protein
MNTGIARAFPSDDPATTSIPAHVAGDGISNSEFDRKEKTYENEIQAAHFSADHSSDVAAYDTRFADTCACGNDGLAY